jgi:hypothetical protein
MQVIDTSSPFDHDIHMDPQKVGKPLDCAACHSMVKTDGSCPKQEVRFPKHEACAGCHTANFYTPPLTICTNCHASAGFKAQNALRELTRQVTPRKAEFSHKSHLNGRGNDCTSCHEFVKGGISVSHPSHPNCCECHTKGGIEPPMANCQGCHNAALNVSRPASKIHDFSHKMHNTDPRTGASTQCTQCHVNTQEAASLRTIRIPPMASCVQCHDGSDPSKPNPQNPQWRGTGAFHFSSCMKCHLPGSINGVPLPPSHPTDTTAPPGAIQ